MWAATLIVLYIFMLKSNICESANILYVIPLEIRSHYITLRPIGLELAGRGHNVTVITSYEEREHPPGYHQVFVDTVKTFFDEEDESGPNLLNELINITVEKLTWKYLWPRGISLTENYLKSSQVQELLEKDNQFDLVITEQFTQEAFHALAYKYRTPLVLVSTFGNTMKHNIVTSNPLQLATISFEFANIEEPSSFIARLRNLYYTLFEYTGWKYWYLRRQEELMRKYIPNLSEDMPSLFEMQRNASLLLSNRHFSFDTPAAYLPNIVEIGGIHLKRTESKLPEDLKNILDEAEYGAVYVCLGSNVRSSELPEEKKRTFLKVFGRLKETVLWKWEDEDAQDLPKNVVTRKWMPQNEILAHPKVKVFISHGGLLSTQEAMFYGVPMLGIPIFADQYKNLRKVANLGFGKLLHYHDINEQIFETNLKELLEDNSYKDRAVEVSKRFEDRPMKPLDTAVFWIEYVIRNKGADFMKNPAKDISWITVNMIDVYIFVFMVTAISVFILAKLTYVLIDIAISKRKKKKHKLF